MEFFDSHAHYNDSRFDDDREDVLQKAYNANITKILTAGYNIESSMQAIELSKKYEYIYASCRNFSKRYFR